MLEVVKKKHNVASPDGKGGVSVVITVHNEGNLIAKCVESCKRSLREAEGYFSFYELILVCDNPDRSSWELATFLAEEGRVTAIHRTDFSDPGPARNFGAEVARGEYLTFVDGDDLISQDYIKLFLIKAQVESNSFFRPRTVLTFGREKVFLLQCDSKDMPNSEMMIFSNPWAMPVFGRRAYFLQNPFEKDDKSNGFSHEDWEWNLSVLNKGIAFEVVDGTVYFARRRHGSRMMEARDFQYVLKPLEFYRNKDNFTREDLSSVDFIERFKSKRVGTIDNEDYLKPRPFVLREMRDRNIRSALDHYLRFGRSAGASFRKLEAEDHIGKFVANETLPSLVALSDLEAWLDPFSFWNQDVIHYNVLSPERDTKIWRALLDSGIFDRRWDVVFILPWVRRGGADLVALKHVRACSDLGLNVCVITTLDAENEWAERTPKNVPILPFGELAKELSEDIKLEVFHRLLIELQPKAIHNVNANLFWKILTRNGLSIRSNTRVICSLYCQDYNSAGSSVGYDRYVDLCDRHIDYYVTDNTVYANYLSEKLGVMTSKIITVRYPIEIGSVNATKNNYEELRKVLWASRLDYQKGFGILRSVAASAPELDFHFFGEVMLDQFDISELEFSRNLVYRGKFAHVQEIDPDEFDCFLYTARWDGLPNIVLEMGMKGLPIISFTTGGLTDVVKEETAFPIEEISIGAVRTALIEFYKGEEKEWQKRTKRMRQLLVREHTSAKFLAQCGVLYCEYEHSVLVVNTV